MSTTSITLENTKEELNGYLQSLLNKNGSILHIKNNSQVKARIQNKLYTLSKTPLNGETLKFIIKILVLNNIKSLMDNKEYEGIYKLDTIHRFKFHIYTHQNGFAIVFKALPSKIKTFKELHLPNSLQKIVDLEQGLVIISGDNSSGKSTILATIINNINKKHNYHIITLEDHIEYIYNEELSTIEQKEIKTHTISTTKAIKSIIKEDPDIIAIDKVADSEVARHILDLINRGYLVIITMNALSTKETISKFLDFFDHTQKEHARHTLAYMLKAIILQELVINKDKKLLPIVEIMYHTENTKEAILNNQEDLIKSIIEKDSLNYDSITLEQSLHKLYTAGQISKDTIYNKQQNTNDIKMSSLTKPTISTENFENNISYTIKFDE